MSRFFKILYNKIINKDLIIDFCFGLLVLGYWNEIGSHTRIITAALEGDLTKVLDTNSPKWCEQSVYAMVQCQKFELYTDIPIVILASLMYFKHKKSAFFCLFLLPIFCFLIERIFIWK